MKFYPTKYEGYFVSKAGEIVSYRKPAVCKGVFITENYTEAF